MLAHFFGCGFHYIGRIEIQKDIPNNWLLQLAVDPSESLEVYLDSVYFAFVTATTVGYGDISPVTVYEKIYVMFFTLISSVQFAYTVNTIGSIFQEMA